MSLTEPPSASPKADTKLAYTIDEWCAASGLGRSKTYTEIKASRLKSVRRGGRTLILRDDAMAYLRGNTGNEEP
jgi:hypothetical protein